MTKDSQRIYDYYVDFIFHYDGQDFVWDTRKAEINLAKHNLAFEQACLVFFDPLTIYADASTATERRHSAIGHSKFSGLVFVVHLIREDNAIRIISARRATRKERHDYETNNRTD